MKMVHNKTHFDNFDVVIDIRCRKKWCVMVRHDETQHIDGIGFIYGCIMVVSYHCAFCLRCHPSRRPGGKLGNPAWKSIEV